jgi:hypothetical protein
MAGFRVVAPLIAAALTTPACLLVSLGGLTGGAGPTDATTDDSEGGTLQGYAAVVSADSPLAYWRFDEHAGATTAHDASGHGNDATYQGGVTLGAPGALGGDPDTAASFDGVTGFVDAGNRFQFAGQTPFSVEAWVLPGPETSYVGVMSRNDAVGGPPSEGYLLFLAPDGGPFGFQRLEGEQVSTAVTTASPSTSAFTHLVATFDGVEMSVYADGELQGAQTASFSIAGAVADFVVGAEAGGSSNYFAGTLDEVAVYDHALTSDRVRAHYLAGLGSP